MQRNITNALPCKVHGLTESTVSGDIIGRRVTQKNKTRNLQPHQHNIRRRLHIHKISVSRMNAEEIRPAHDWQICSNGRRFKNFPLSVYAESHTGIDLAQGGRDHVDNAVQKLRQHVSTDAGNRRSLTDTEV